MEVILLERVAKLGNMGEIVKVRDGFARNFLIPQKKALRATEQSKVEFEKRKSELIARNDAARKDAEAAAKKLQGASITLVRQASEDGKLYGSVTVRDIAQGLTDAGYKVDRGAIQLHTTLKTIGAYTVELALHPEVSSKLTVAVVRNEADGEKTLEDFLKAEEAEKEPASKEAKEDDAA